ELVVHSKIKEISSKGVSPQRGKNGFVCLRASSLSPDARSARISSLGNTLSISSNLLVSIASQLFKDEKREHALSTPGCWNQLRSMADAKDLLQYMFNNLLVYKAGKRFLYVKRNRANLLGKDKVDGPFVPMTADSKLASLFGKLKYEENLIDIIYLAKKKKSLSTATLMLTSFISSSIVQDFQDIPDDEENRRSIKEYMNDLEEEFHERALLAKSKRKSHFARDCFSKTLVFSYSSTSQNNTQPKFFSTSQQKPKLRPTKDFKAKYNKVKAKLALLNFGASTSKSLMVKNNGLVAKAYEWDEEDVSSDDNEMVEVKVLMTLADDENVVVGKEISRNGEWVKISMRKVHTLHEMEDNDERKTFTDYLCIDLNYVEE
nr:kinesin-like protein KIN-4A [Tanacetum cinerariifolium]